MQGQLRSLENPSSSGPQNLANHQSGCPPLAATNPSGAGALGSHDTNRRSGYGLQTKYTLYLTAVPSANRLPAWSEKEAAAQPPAEAGGANSRKLGKRPYGTADLAQPCGAPCSGEASDAVLVWPR